MMKRLIAFAVAAISGIAFAQQTYTTTSTTVVKNVVTTIVEQVTYEEQNTDLKTIAVFVQNRTRVPGMDDEVDGVRDRKTYYKFDTQQVQDHQHFFRLLYATQKYG